MTEKVKVSKEIGKALDYWYSTELEDTKEDLLVNHGVSIFENKTWHTEYEVLNQLTMVEMANIVVNGYEVEETIEDKILQDYQDADKKSRVGSDYSESSFWIGYKSGIFNTLSKLEIQIEGIN